MQIYDNRPDPETGQDYTVTHVQLNDRIPDETMRDLPRLLGAYAPTLIDRIDDYSVHHRSDAPPIQNGNITRLT